MKQPYAIETNYTVAAADLGEAERLWDRVDEFARSLGLLGEGGMIEQMPAGDVIADSPLEKQLTE